MNAHFWGLRKAAALLLGLAVAAMSPASQAAFTKYDTQTYDYFTLGAPKFVNTAYIDLRKITGLSKFRSNEGHDYSDTSQFGNDGYRDPVTHRVEDCRSMKHYFMAPDALTTIYAPTSGVVSRMFDEQIGGTQVQITSDVQPAFTFIMFHVVLTKPLKEGDRVTEGEVLGHHTGTQTWSDMAVAVHTPAGYHLISYFETLTDQTFAAFQARGVASRDDLILSKDYRAAYPTFYCATATSPVPPSREVVQLTGGAATQSLTILSNISGVVTAGDPAIPVSATSSSGLPVTITTLEPKVCKFANGMVSWRRAGTCTVVYSQPGNDDNFAAPTLSTLVTVLAQGEPLYKDRPYLGGLYPPSSSGVQSYLRFYNTSSTAGTVTASLLNGDTGAVVATWTSPAIPSRSTAQFTIGNLEAAATTALTARPSVYGIRIEAPTTLYGYMQHVLFDAASGGVTNASACKTGTVGAPEAAPFIYSSLFTDYVSTLVLANPATYDYAFGLDTTAALSGKAIGFTAYYPFVYQGQQAVEPLGQYLLKAGEIETRLSYKPPMADPILAARMISSIYLSGYMQNIVTNKRANLISDMTAACGLTGNTRPTIASPLFTTYVMSPTPATGQSFFRFYNAGSTANTATVILHDPDTGFVLGQGTTPSIAPGAEYQYTLDAIENAPGFIKKSLYTATVGTDIDGYFQHVLYRAPDGALSNMSTCSASVTVEGSTLIGVHSSLVGAAGYPSTVIVNNTGAAAASVMLDIFDARDGSLLTTYTTPVIAANAQARLTVAAIESATGYTPTASVGHYVVKVRGAFTGYLQHYVNNTASGVVTDMTAMCGM